MGQILRNWRIPIAAIFSVLIIVGAYLLARSVRSPQSAEASTESALLKAIATKDSDGDGLPDWEEALYGTSPNTTDTFTLGMTDGEAVAKGLIVPKAIADISVATSSQAVMPIDGSLPPAPAEGTLTAAFAKNFFMLYLSAKQAKGGADLSEGEMMDVSNKALSSLSASITTTPDFKSAKDLKISGSGVDALKAYAVSAEAVLLKNTIGGAVKSEILYLQDAVQNNDAAAPVFIASIAKGYRDSAVGLSMLTVPEELATEHLALINAIMRISGIASDFTRVNTDVLATILALHQYPQAVSSLGNAFIHIGEAYQTAGVSLPEGEPGASFVNLIADIASEQAAAKKP
ncbi:MAG: thrombospondin type 3 repeat-containing protein [bacterium]|nr:thrombospondin type 3 repeat-containing protein [bacterium]